ncbi:MAG: SRPBCC family protein [Candidatus Aminicenantes bacterium]|nr:SRPBCC family protein [Candidatus Aminicenantes bacterium]MDH5385426.1 SRPBCC family protein [Candidatus Aminicenantes bacterium]MDH5744039.1 SRPBCC family protein [Candidatus Aminicenantes bacterium]
MAFKQLMLKDSIEIKTTPEKIWEFFVNLEKNYKSWHPEDHVLFKWTKGKPMEEDSAFYAEQYVMGKVKKYKGSCVEIVPNRKFVFKFSFPISLVSPKAEWQIEPKGSYSVFTAITYMRLGRLFQKLFRKEMEKLAKAHDKHVGAEGENLKKILEKQNN